MDRKMNRADRLFQLRWDLRYYEGQLNLFRGSDSIEQLAKTMDQVVKHQRMIAELE